jgi:hypothetical protein
MVRRLTFWKVILAIVLLVLSLPALAFGWLVLDDSRAREYLYWATSVIRADIELDDPFSPPLPLITAGEVTVEAGLGTISWMDGGRMIEGDMFMNTPQLARWRELRAGSIPLGTAVTILFPELTRRITLSRWRFGKEVESQEIPNGHTFSPTRRGTHIFGIHASFYGDAQGNRSGGGHYAFILRVR